LSGAVLVTFGLFFLTVISKVGMDRIDREILTLGESQLHVWHLKEHWQGFDRSLRSIYGQKAWKELIVQVTDADHQLLYRSPHWPQEITTTSFSRFDFKMEKGPVASPGGRDSLEHSTGSVDRADIGHNALRVTDKRRHNLRPLQPADDKHDRPPSALRPPNTPVRIKKPFFLTMETAVGFWRTGIMGNQHITIMIGMDLAGFYQDAARYKRIFLGSVPLALLMLAAGGWLIVHRALKPVALITRTTESITARGLDQRIPETGANSELLHLVKVINNMFDRLEKSFGQAVRFSADAAHELQTPLTILQGVLDDAVQHCAPDTDEQRRYSSLLEEVQRLKNIVRKLLILARADADQLRLRLEPVDMSVMIESAVEDAGIINPHLNIEKHILRGVTIQADPDLFRLVIQGLTSNAVKYSTGDGLIRFRLTVQNNEALFKISNTGVPIPDTERERIFDRFYRIDKSRSRRVPGIGLGLSLAREIVRAHKGELRLEATTDNMNTFALSLPCRQ
jgi:signal transduction histidine kinase